jgi:Amt family ammonium transporter
VPFTYIGAMLLWVGWFGFNAGSAAAADTVASLAFLNTVLATAAAVLGWTLVEAISKGKPSALGALRVRWPAWSASPRPVAPSARSARS